MTNDADDFAERYKRHLLRNRQRQQHWRERNQRYGNGVPLKILLPAEQVAALDAVGGSRSRSGLISKALALFLPGEISRTAGDAAIPEGMTPAQKITALRRNRARAEVDAQNRVPVRITFDWEHDHLPWGMRQIMWDNGLRHRRKVWIGRLRPERAETMKDEVSKFTGVLEITGALGDAPKWAPGDY